MLKRFNSLQASLLLHELSFVFLVLITGTVGIIWSVSWQHSSEESLRLSSMNTTMQNIRGELYRQLKEVFDASFLHDKDAENEYQAYTKTINSYFVGLTALAVDEHEHDAIKRVSDAYQKFHGETAKLLGQPELDINQKDLLDKQLEQYVFAQLEHAFTGLDTVLKDKQNALSLSRQRWTTRLSWLAPIPVLLAIGLLIAARHFVRRNVVQPLADVIDGAKRISKGDLQHTIPLMGVADLIRLSEAINAMADEIAVSRDRLIETKKQAALGELVPLVAHNIRNPLAGIRAASQVARDEDPSMYTKDALTDIIVAVDRLERWVTSLLSYLHPVEPHLSQTTLTAVADNALSLIELQLADKEITIERVGWKEASKIVAVDIHLFEQAIFNLVQNALETSSSGDVIQLHYSQQPEQVSLTIADQGLGMKYDPVAEQVTDGGAKRQGCGLGIPFSLKVIKQHAGQLIYGTTSSGGTIVTIKLPITNHERANEKV
ncbi:MAG: HAMP domain-containing histidine kinase [Gammaproteobacteria bacterium]|nr:HAMP domain-containing histidine kinase [Gammaproteobacteria bacterium]